MTHTLITHTVMTRGKILSALIIGGALTGLLAVSPVFAAPQTARQLENLLTHNAVGSRGAADFLANQATDASLPTSVTLKRLLTHDDTGTVWPAGLATNVQATDGSSSLPPAVERLLTHQDVRS